MFNIIACVAMAMLTVMAAVVTVAYIRQLGRDEREEYYDRHRFDNAKIIACPKFGDGECLNIEGEDCEEFNEDLKAWAREWRSGRIKEEEAKDVDS